MKNFIDLLLNDSVLFLIGITIVVLIVLIIICIILLKKRYDLDNHSNGEAFKERDVLAELSTLTKVEEPVKEDIQIETPNVEKAVIEENKVDDNKIDLEAMLSQMEETLNEKEKAIVTFEQEQEEKAIISYEELKKAVNQNNNTEVTKVETLEPKPIIKSVSVPNQEVNNNDNKGFKNTDFISPVFGKMENNYEYPKIGEFDEREERSIDKVNQNLNFAKHREDKNEAFLDNLKQFRKNLE